MPKKSADVTCKIEKIHAVLSESGHVKKVFASIRWNDGEPRNEIRNIMKTESGDRVLKGISLTDDELEKLITAYKKLKKVREKSEDSVPWNFSAEEHQGVNLEEIYTSASGIIQKRSDGNLTKDGFIVLERL